MVAEPLARVKICGIRSIEAASVATEAGVDYLGFILAPSRRQISLDEVAEIRSGLRDQFGGHPPLVGVLVNPSRSELAHIVGQDVFDLIQLSGDEDPAISNEVGIPYIKALRAEPGESREQLAERMDGWMNLANPPIGIMLDTWHAGSYGGTGLTGDWTLAASLAGDYPIWLAGGLDSQNVGDAIATVRPFAVDLSSGVETDGVKDPVKIRAFLAATGSTFTAFAGSPQR